MKRRALVLAFVFLTVFLTSHLFAQEAAKFSIPLPLTGSNAKFGEIEKNAYEIAKDEINAKDGIKGRKVELEFEDSQGKPEVSRSIAEKLIDVKKQPVLFGEYSSACSKAIAPVAEERKIPYMVVTGATDDITQQNYKYVFRMNPTNAYYASGMMSFLQEVVKPTTMAILYESSDFGTSGAEEMVIQCQKTGIKVLIKEKYEKGAVDFRPILSKVKAANPDVIGGPCLGALEDVPDNVEGGIGLCTMIGGVIFIHLLVFFCELLGSRISDLRAPQGCSDDVIRCVSGTLNELRNSKACGSACKEFRIDAEFFDLFH